RPGEPFDWQDRHGWPEDLDEIVYIDHFGNCMTGVRAATTGRQAVIELKGQHIRHAETFAAVPQGQAFWYENSNGLIEIAVNRGSAMDQLGVKIGSACSPVAGK
ncbi:MAG: SAM-dependent chlorinase/fluorinase, partial [Thiotrichales bacterium]|nr:SAM-dependent chlorinase/fluorinase [Thiotrichales bacterium]